MNLEQYLNMTAQTKDDMLDQVKPEAVKQIKKSLVVEAVANKEGFEVTDEDKEAELENLSKQYQMDIEKVKEIMGEEQMEALALDVKMKKAVEFIVSKAKEV